MQSATVLGSAYGKDRIWIYVTGSQALSLGEVHSDYGPPKRITCSNASENRFAACRLCMFKLALNMRVFSLPHSWLSHTQATKSPPLPILAMYKQFAIESPRYPSSDDSHCFLIVLGL